MLRLRKILFPTDLSPCAESAYTYAALLAERTGAALHAVYVRRPDEPLETATVGLLPVSARDVAPDLGFPAGHPGPAVEVHLPAVDAAAALLAYAAEGDFDLVVMGARGRSGAHLPLLGGVAERVVRHAPCPVLTVRTRAPEGGIRRVLAPTDFSACSRLAIPYAVDVAETFGAAVELLHVVDLDTLPGANVPLIGFVRVSADEVVAHATAQVEALAAEAERSGVAAGVRVIRGHRPAADLVAYAEGTAADLIVLASHGYTGLERVLLGSVAEQVVRSAACPVLVVKSFVPSPAPPAPEASSPTAMTSSTTLPAPRELPRPTWAAYFDAFSRAKREAGRIDYAEVRVFSRDIGAQPETRWLPLLGLTYDPRSDLLEVLVEGLDHLVAHPTTIYVDETGDRLDRMEVVRQDGTQEIIEIR